ncbi:MAG TPA: AMP-binding protein [Jatrophihabitans sp.]|nr:AMP-binding protein [Jatrophihabitans sp.]
MDTAGTLRTPVRYAKRVTHTARNLAEVVRFGGLETSDESAPYDVVTEAVNYRLRRYFPDSLRADATPVVLIPPLMITAEIWDVAPTTSAVSALHKGGADPWVVDFGDPQVEPGGRERNLADHVLAVSDAVDRIVQAVGRPVVLGGYSQGGMFAYLATALRRGRDVDSLVTFGSPVDTTAPLAIPLAPDVAARLASDLANSGLLRHASMPGWMASLGFKLLTPARTVQERVQFLLELHDREALLPRERQRRFLASQGWTSYSGPAIAELLDQFIAQNRMLEGGIVVDDRLVTLADIDVPVLSFVGSRDTIGHPDAVRAILRAAPRADIYEVTLPTGHFGLVVGSHAEQTSWPAVLGWLAWRAGGAELPADIVPAESVDTSRTLRPSAVATTVAQATELGIGVSRAMIGSARRAARFAGIVAREAPTQLPRLTRLENLDPTTRISLGQLLDEQARRAPNDVAYLFGDRAARHREVKARVDNIVRGLLHIGVGREDRVGVLMASRPSAFSLVAALSRLGATAVLLRPDGDVQREALLADISWLITDPEHATVSAVPDVPRAVLGGGSRSRELPTGVVDLEQIDPAAVSVPGWYRPNPQVAGDIAFILFTGAGSTTRALRITNRRWALSALGTASAATLRPGDTVYSVTPIHHSSALLMSIGGAIAGGARFAIASADDPDTFWDEVRRYGATHVSYTWASLAPVVNAPANPNEQYHPIRMFFGSGMPRNLWHRVTDRFAPATVLEFYASAEGEAILANLSGRATGSMGKPLPGTAPVKVAAFDLATRSLARGADGFVRECRVDEVGLLLVRVSTPAPDDRNDVFEAGDSWRSTGDLFLRDDHGYLWLAGAVAELVDTPLGVAVPAGARFSLGTIPAADLIVLYGVPDGDSQALVAALTVRPGTDVTGEDLYRALRRLPPVQRPRYVQVVPAIPVTTWHRPKWEVLQERGIPTPGRGRRVWRLGDDGEHYDLVT